jgi:hypothetical protein
MRRQSKLLAASLSVVAIALVCGSVPTHGNGSSSSDCDEVTILDAGTYTIKHSKIAGLGVFHRLGGPVTDVLIRPSAEDSSEISRIYLMQEAEPRAGLVCRSLPNDVVPNSISCSQSVPELGLGVIVKFNAKVPPPYEARMKSVINYLSHEVLGCQMEAPSRSL